jgi:hypothetical protein
MYYLNNKVPLQNPLYYFNKKEGQRLAGKAKKGQKGGCLKRQPFYFHSNC